MTDAVVILQVARIGYAVVAWLSLLLGLFSFLRPALSIMLYQLIMRFFNWAVEPIHRERELRNTRLLGIVLILEACALFWLLSRPA